MCGVYSEYTPVRTRNGDALSFAETTFFFTPLYRRVRRRVEILARFQWLLPQSCRENIPLKENVRPMFKPRRTAAHQYSVVCTRTDRVEHGRRSTRWLLKIRIDAILLYTYIICKSLYQLNNNNNKKNKKKKHKRLLSSTFEYFTAVTAGRLY